MIKAYCDRCNEEIPVNTDSEYIVCVNVKNTGWVGNRVEVYYDKDLNAANATKHFFLCGECLKKFSNMVNSFMESQQKGGNKE